MEIESQHTVRKERKIYHATSCKLDQVSGGSLFKSVSATTMSHFPPLHPWDPKGQAEECICQTQETQRQNDNSRPHRAQSEVGPGQMTPGPGFPDPRGHHEISCAHHSMKENIFSCQLSK